MLVNDTMEMTKWNSISQIRIFRIQKNSIPRTNTITEDMDGPHISGI